MSLPDLTDDLTGVMDYLEPLTLRRADTAVETHIPQALRRVVSERESAASGGEILLADVHFHLPTSA
ncbi:MAG: hypothetical protein SGJ20_15970, partial [Planctomycetota bacterium]|nr:hypothetical protein [Planctomycetota bacterium]